MSNIKLEKENIYLEEENSINDNTLIEYLENRLRKRNIKISLKFDCLREPTFKDLEQIITACSIAHLLKKRKKNILIKMTMEMDKVQREAVQYFHANQFCKVLNIGSKLAGVNVDFLLDTMDKEEKTAKQFLRLNQENIINGKKELCLKNRCPICYELVESETIKNGKAIFNCPEHKEFSVDIEKNWHSIYYSNSLKKVLRDFREYEENKSTPDWECIRITTSEYEGPYQEKLFLEILQLFKGNNIIQDLPLIIYAPLFRNAFKMILSDFCTYDSFYNNIKYLDVIQRGIEQPVLTQFYQMGENWLGDNNYKKVYYIHFNGGIIIYPNI